MFCEISVAIIQILFLIGETFTISSLSNSGSGCLLEAATAAPDSLRFGDSEKSCRCRPDKCFSLHIENILRWPGPAALMYFYAFAVAANLRKIIDGHPQVSSVTFGLHPGSMPANKLPEEANLLGFAQLSLVDS